MCSYEQEEESEEHHDVGETNSICVLDADGILLGSALPLRDHWLSLNIKKGREKAIVSYYSSFVVLSLSPLSMRSLWPHSLPLLPNKKQGSRNFSAFLAYAIKSRTEKKTIGQQLPKIQSCRDWTDSLLSLTLHSVWKCPKKLIEYKMKSFLGIHFSVKFVVVFSPKKWDFFVQHSNRSQ